MDFSKILEYQNKDGDLFRIEFELNQNENKKTYQEMIGMVKKAQDKSALLENRAGELLKDFESLKKVYGENVSQVEKFISKNLAELSEKDLDTIINATNSITNNLNILEKKLFSEAENLNLTLNDFNSTKKIYGNARAKYLESKNKYDEEVKVKNPQIERIKSELVKLEKDIDPKLLTKYKHLRGDRIYPVFVRLMDNRSCGGCGMERSAAEIDRLKSQGYMECDNCHRVIFIFD
jgi:predicted  nucleic acid-binding Zn-ribbon protein